MKDLKTRIALLFAGLGLLCAIVAAMGMWGVSTSERRAQDNYRKITLSIQYLEESYRFQLLAALALMEAISDIDPVTRQKSADFAVFMQHASDEQAQRFSGAEKHKNAKEVSDRFIQDRAAAMNAMTEAIALVRKGDGAAALMAVQQRLRPPGMAEGQDIGELIQRLTEASRQARDAGANVARLLMIVMVATLGMGGGGMAVCVWRQMRSLNRGLGAIETTLDDVSRSLDLSLRAPDERADEIGRTAGAFNVLLTRIEREIGVVQQAAQDMRTATAEIVSGHMDLSARTQQQAASLEQTAAAMAQLSDTVRRNADDALQANRLANEASGLARAGDEATQRLVGTIERVGERAGKISEITDIIEAIAFQTNILALNAAVEAARAGEQGRGFAVVAGEVRALAQRCAAAAKEISDLIDSSVKVIHDSAGQATEVNRSVDGAMLAIERVAVLVTAIASACSDQSQSIAEVSRAVALMDEATQRNAAMVEQTAVVTHSLEGQADNLHAAVSTFYLSV